MARDALAALVKNKNVRCATQAHDRNNRPVAVCHADGVDLGEALVDQGLAIASRSFSERYVPNEERAKAEKRGLWAGDFVWPRDWRDRKKKDDQEGLFLVPPQPCPPPPFNPGAEACLIKGNVNGRKRIYHMPGTRHYEKVEITPDKGDRYFCTEDDAIACGWRRPGR